MSTKHIHIVWRGHFGEWLYQHPYSATNTVFHGLQERHPGVVITHQFGRTEAPVTRAELSSNVEVIEIVASAPPDGVQAEEQNQRGSDLWWTYLDSLINGGFNKFVRLFFDFNPDVMHLRYYREVGGTKN